MELKVAALLKRLASGDENKSIYELLGIGESTCCQVAYEAACAVMSQLGHLVLRERYAQRLPSVQAEFQAHKGFGWRAVSGAVDGTHIAIKRPKGTRGKAYYSCNRKFDVILQAVTAPDLTFLDVNIGHAGAVHDSVVFRTSLLGLDISSGAYPICQQAPYVEDGQPPLPGFLLGDKGYKVDKHIITPYSAAAERRNPACAVFNYRFSSMRMCVESAFGELKATWRLLCSANRVLVCQHDRVNQYILAGILLHNWFKEIGHDVDEDARREKVLGMERERVAREEREEEQVEGQAEGGGGRDRVRDQIFNMWVAEQGEDGIQGGRRRGRGGDARGRDVRQRVG